MFENHLSQPRMQSALSADVPKIYVNGFGVTATLGDIMISLETNGRPAGVLNMSYTVATTLAARLSALLGAFEERTGRPMLTIEAVAELLGRQQELGSAQQAPAIIAARVKGGRRKSQANGQGQQETAPAT